MEIVTLRIFGYVSWWMSKAAGGKGLFQFFRKNHFFCLGKITCHLIYCLPKCRLDFRCFLSQILFLPKKGWLEAWVMNCVCDVMSFSMAEISSQLVPVKISSQTYFCSDTACFWLAKYPLYHSFTKILSPHWTRTFTVLKLYIIFEVSGGKVEHTIKPQHLAK